MTLFDSSPSRAVRSKRYRYYLAGIALLWCILTVLLVVFSSPTVERRVNRFFATVEAQHFPRALST